MGVDFRISDLGTGGFFFIIYFEDYMESRDQSLVVREM